MAETEYEVPLTSPPMEQDAGPPSFLGFAKQANVAPAASVAVAAKVSTPDSPGVGVKVTRIEVDTACVTINGAADGGRRSIAPCAARKSVIAETRV